tara:strand:+ start:92598 stop:93905 length:1308 start_codon:yes stop_codon:yes gene_type:complete
MLGFVKDTLFAAADTCKGYSSESCWNAVEWTAQTFVGFSVCKEFAAPLFDPYTQCAVPTALDVMNQVFAEAQERLIASTTCAIGDGTAMVLHSCVEAGTCYAQSIDPTGFIVAGGIVATASVAGLAYSAYKAYASRSKDIFYDAPVVDVPAQYELLTDYLERRQGSSSMALMQYKPGALAQMQEDASRLGLVLLKKQGQDIYLVHGAGKEHELTQAGVKAFMRTLAAAHDASAAPVRLDHIAALNRLAYEHAPKLANMGLLSIVVGTSGVKLAITAENIENIQALQEGQLALTRGEEDLLKLIGSQPDGKIRLEEDSDACHALSAVADNCALANLHLTPKERTEMGLVLVGVRQSGKLVNYDVPADLLGAAIVEGNMFQDALANRTDDGEIEFDFGGEQHVDVVELEEKVASVVKQAETVQERQAKRSRAKFGGY